MDHELLEGLTEPQRRAVSHVDGPLLVLAGPGSGKTTVVTRRVAYLIAQGIPPWRILALTFTNKAAGEMRDRINALLPENLYGRRGLTVSTFHSFCARLLRRYAHEVNLPENYSVYDAADQRETIKRAIAEAELNTKNWTPGVIASAISNAKNQLMNAAAFAAEADDFYRRTIARIYTAYERKLKANSALDFDDLLLYTAKLLKDNEAVRLELQERYEYLLIDEYQDTNHAQFVIAHSLAASSRNICVVGDPDQSIYGWRGADIRNILEFEEQYPQAAIIPLGQNFRSTGHIVRTADVLIRNNRRRKHKELHTELGEGNKPAVIIYRDEHHEAESLVDEFRRRNEEGVAWKDMAVLYRVNSLSRVLEESFRNANVPYVIARGTAFYDRKEIKDALAYLRAVANPHDDVSLMRIINTPTRGIGKTSLNKIELHAMNNQLSLIDAMRNVETVADLSTAAINAVQKFVAMFDGWRRMIEQDDPQEGLLATGGESALADLVDRIVRESGLERMYAMSKAEEDAERAENIAELVTAAAEFEPTIDDRDPIVEQRPRSLQELLTAYLESVALVSDADAIDPANGAVTLMTLHAAKGLEFTVVAMVGLEEGLLPHSRAAADEAELEEERRLCFVGITRAKRDLIMTRAASRAHRGLRERTIESQFLRELPAESVVRNDFGAIDEWDDDDDGGSGGDKWGRSREYSARGASGSSRARSGLYVEFPIGSLVRHPTFGVGRVEAITPRPAGSAATVSFSSVGVKTLILEYAKLERLETE